MKEQLKKIKLLSSIKRILTYTIRKQLCQISPEKTSKYLYKKTYGKTIDLKNPRTFNEKLQWLKLNRIDDTIIRCADKYEMHNYIKEQGCSEILCRLHGVYNSTQEIDFTVLPNKFVLKATHGCGYNIICQDKKTFDQAAATKQLDKWLKRKFGYESCELHYTKITPKIICEEFLEDETHDNLIDYKIYCFNGQPMYTLVCSERSTEIKKHFYDINWNKVNLRKDNSEFDISRPSCYDEMLDYATKLSKPFSFVRVDFYNVKGKPILGELTFTPAACLSTEYTEEAEQLLGDLIVL